MSNKKDMKEPEMYWTKGPFQPRVIYSNPNISDSLKDEVCKILKSFIDSCHHYHIAFNTAMYGANVASEVLGNDILRRTPRIDYRADRIFRRFSNQKPNQSINTEASYGEFLQLSGAGGKFEDFYAKAFIVLVYSLWEEYFRVKIAEKIPIDKNQIKCNLMGDMRLIRHYIAHNNSVVNDKTIAAFKTIQMLHKMSNWREIKEIAVGEELPISKYQINALMVQITALHIRICN